MSGFLKIINDILCAVFDNVLAPILIEYYKLRVKMIIELITSFFSWLLYFIFTTLLKFIQTLNNMFEMFAGSSKGRINDGSTTVLEYMIQSDGVRKFFLVFTILGIALSILFTIISAFRSISDMTLDDKNPISKVLSNSLKSLVSFIVVPILCLFLIQVSNVVVDTIDAAALRANGSNSKSIDQLIWLNCSYNASTNPNYNYKTADESAKETIAQGDDKYRQDYVSGKKDYAYTAVKDDATFKKNFDYKKFDYAQGIVTAVLIMILYFAVIMSFIGRVFELIILFIIGPVFSASIANDGGEMFKSWKDMFIAKFIGSYSMVLGMRLYMVLAPVICSGAVQFSTTQIECFDEGLFNTFIQLLFLVGGAYSIYKSQFMILRLLSIEAATAAEQSSQAALGAAKFIGYQIPGVSNVLAAVDSIGKFDSNKQAVSKTPASSSSSNAYKGGNPNGN